MTHLRKCHDTVVLISWHTLESVPLTVFPGTLFVTRKLGYHKKELVWKFMEDVSFLRLYDYPRPYWWSLKVDNAEMLGGRPSKMGLVESPHDRECSLCCKNQVCNSRLERRAARAALEAFQQLGCSLPRRGSRFTDWSIVPLRHVQPSFILRKMRCFSLLIAAKPHGKVI
jgi:hypothetical protein